MRCLRVAPIGRTAAFAAIAAGLLDYGRIFVVELDASAFRALSASGGEYKRLTVLFADIRNSTSLIDSFG